MKITILQGAFLPVPTLLGGAVEKMWFALGRIFFEEGHEVIHISRMFGDMPEQEIISGVLHKRVKGYDTPSSGLLLKWRDLKYTLRARKLINIDTDIVVTNTFWAPILLWKLRKKIFVDIQRMPKGQMKFYLKSARLRANSTSVERAIKAEISALYFKNIVMIPNPLPFIQENNNADYIYTKEKVILYTGRVHPEKGLDILIKAFQLISESYCDWSLKIVGPWSTNAGGGGEEYLKFLKSLIYKTNCIEFVGPIYDIDDLNKYYESASIFVYPSVAEKGETFGIAPLEAMSWGCVPIVSSLDCFQDFIAHEDNGLIFDHSNLNAHENLAECIFNLLSNEYFRFMLSKKSLDVNQTHSAKRIAQLFLQDFKRIQVYANK